VMLVVPLAHLSCAAHIEPQPRPGQTLLLQSAARAVAAVERPAAPVADVAAVLPPPATVQAVRTQLGPPAHRPWLVSHTQPALKAEQVSPAVDGSAATITDLPQVLALGLPSQTSFLQSAPPTQEFVAVLHTQPDWKLAHLSPQSIPRPQPSPTFPQ